MSELLEVFSAEKEKMKKLKLDPLVILQIAKAEYEIEVLQAKIHKLKGPQITLCGMCYGKETKDHNCYGVGRVGHCPIKVYLSEWHEYEKGRWTHNE